MSKPKSFIRQRTVTCGANYREIEIYPLTSAQTEAVRGRRSKRRNVTPPKQKNLNDRRSKDCFRQVVMTNFFEGDIILYLTYKPKFAPKTLGEAETRRRNYIRRVAYLCRKRGLDAPKVIWVAEYGEEGGNLHHHILIHCELSRDELESLWRDTKSGESLGFTRSVRIQGEAESIDDLAGYISKNFGCSDDGEISPAYTGDEPDAKPKRGRPKNKRRWGGSTNLLRPQEKTNDSAYSRREVERIAKAQPSREDWEKRYPGWTTINGDSAVKYYYNEITGWYIRLRMKRKAVCRREE